jgi:hypothetical protein
VENKKLQRLQANELIAAEDKEKVKRLFEISDRIQFGQINRYLEGYILDDYKLPRCTSILQMDGSKAGGLMEWAKRQVAGRIEMLLVDKLTQSYAITYGDVIRACQQGLAEPDKQKDDAAIVGTGEHDNVERWLWKEKFVLTPALEMFIKAWKESGYTPVATEIPVIWHDEEGRGFGGRIDILAYKEGKFYIGDNKTSRSIHESYGCQVAAYKAAIEQMSDIKIEGGTIFHIPNVETLNDRQKKEFEKRGSLVQLKNLEEAFEHYRLLLGLYYKRNNKYF